MSPRRASILLLTLSASLVGPIASLDAQEAEPEGEEEHELAGRHRLTLGLGHTHVSQGEIDGKTEWLVAASWAFNYDFWLTDRWAIGMQNDLILEQFPVEHGEGELVEREYPLSVIPAVLFKPGEWLTLIGGVGAEIAAGETLFLTRLGFEGGRHVSENWEVGGALVWDNKWNYYNSWALAFTLSRFLG